MELYADATRCRTVEPAAPDAVLLGTAMVAAAGCGLHPTLAAAGVAMHQGGVVREPDAASAGRYERDWRVFLAMQRHRAEVQRLLRSLSTGGVSSFSNSPRAARAEELSLDTELKIRGATVEYVVQSHRNQQSVSDRALLISNYIIVGRTIYHYQNF